MQYLTLPKGKVENESFLDFVDPKIEEQWDELGNDLHDLTNIIFSRCKNIFESEGQVLAYN